MKRFSIQRRLLSITPRNSSSGVRRKKRIAVFLMAAVATLAFAMTQGTLGRFSRSFLSVDSAAAAKFDVSITTPDAFWPEQGERVYEYRFLSGTDLQELAFQITNNGETDILCRPYISNGVTYRVYLAGEECGEFAVASGKTVDFGIVIAPDGLDTNIKNAELLIDIQQREGG